MHTQRHLSLAVVCHAALLLASATAIPAAAQENLLINPGFEEGQGGPAGWETFPPEPPGIEYIWNEDFAHQGHRSVCIRAHQSLPAMWRQVVPVEPGVVYVFAAHVAFEDLAPPGDCHLQVAFLNAQHHAVQIVDYPNHTGYRGFALDFPAMLKFRAPPGAVAAEVNLFLHGPGFACFDDILFGRAPTGAIAGRITLHDQPVEGVHVFLWGEPWGVRIEAVTNEQGQYELPDVPLAFPRYVLFAEKPGLQTQVRGKIAIEPNQVTQVHIEMRPGKNPPPMLEIRCGRLEFNRWLEPPQVPPGALIPPHPDGYPPPVRPFLHPDPFITSDQPEIIDLAHHLLDQVPPHQRDRTEAVAWAVYEWISTQIEHDGVFDNPPHGLQQPYRDVTSGIWQTISGEGWCFGGNMYDWAYRPLDTLHVRSAICIEHAWLGAALLRALNIPARAAIGALEFWAQPEQGPGHWVGLSTTAGRTAFRSQGELGPGFASLPMPAFYSVAPHPILPQDWHADHPVAFRERHTWGESYPPTQLGLDRALLDLAFFEQTGHAAQGLPVPPEEDRYQIHYSAVTLNVPSLRPQRFLDARFPVPGPSPAHEPLTDHVGAWTNHPECVVDRWIEVIEEPPIEGAEIWAHIRLDLAPLFGLGDMNCDGRVNFTDINPLILALSNPEEYIHRFPDCDISHGDCNGDGGFNFDDINPFIRLLMTP